MFYYDMLYIYTYINVIYIYVEAYKTRTDVHTQSEIGDFKFFVGVFGSHTVSIPWDVLPYTDSP